MVSFEFLVLRVNEKNKFLQFSGIIEFGFFMGLLPNFIQSSGHKKSGLDVTCRLVSLSTRTTYIRLEVSLPIE